MQIKNNNMIFLSTTKTEPCASSSGFQCQGRDGWTSVSRKGWVEYKVPSMGFTDALVKLQYLCLGHRPLKLSCNGALVSQKFAQASSGGFKEKRHLKWTPAEPLSELDSEFIIRLETPGSFPNLSCLKFELFNSAEKLEEIKHKVREEVDSLRESGLSEESILERALSVAQGLVEYSPYVAEVPTQQIQSLVQGSPAEDESGETIEESEEGMDRTARAEAREEARRAMRAKRKEMMRRAKMQKQQTEDESKKDQVAAVEEARLQQRAAMAAMKRKKRAAAKQAEAAAKAAASTEPLELDPIAVLQWAESLGEQKLRGFVASRCQGEFQEAQLNMVMHLLIVVFLKKTRKQKKQPSMGQTKECTSHMASLVKVHSVDGVLDMLLNRQEEEEDSHSGGDEAESDEELDYQNELRQQEMEREAEEECKRQRQEAIRQKKRQRAQERKRLGEEARRQKELEAEQEQQRLEEEALRQQKLERQAQEAEQERQRLKREELARQNLLLTQALCQELHDLCWNVREAQYFFEMQPGNDGSDVCSILARIDAKIREIESVDTAGIPEGRSLAIKTKVAVRTEVGYIRARFDKRQAAAAARDVCEGYATLAKISTWCDECVNSIEFEHSDGTKRRWGDLKCGAQASTELSADQPLKTVHFWETRKQAGVGEAIKFWAEGSAQHEAVGEKAKGFFGGIGRPEQKLSGDNILELEFSHEAGLGIKGERTHNIPQGAWLNDVEAYNFHEHVLIAVVGGQEMRCVPLPHETLKVEDGKLVVEKRLM